MKNKKELILDKIRKANPSTLELSFGCEILIQDEFGVENGFVTWIRNTDVPNSKMTVSNIGDMSADDDFEIIGHPLNLQHLLRAMNQIDSSAFIDFCESLWRTNLNGSRELGAYQDLPDYNLSKSLDENLDDENLCELLVEILNIK